MASVETAPITGTFNHPLIKEDTKNDDPWFRNYLQPPKFEAFVPRSYPFHNARPLLSDPGYDPMSLLKTHGFAMVKDKSTFLQQVAVSEVRESEKAIVETYYPEIEKLVKEVTGASSIYIVHSVLRKGQTRPVEHKLPLGLVRVVDGKDEVVKKSISGYSDAKITPTVSIREGMHVSQPSRTPHVDWTPLGARQTIRLNSVEVVEHAKRCGIIAAEDKICQENNVAATSEESDQAIFKHYNEAGRLGPRYAAYSIWRPLKTVRHDPLALSPIRHVPHGGSPISLGGGGVYWPYLNKWQGIPELGGDYLKQLAMLGMRDDPASKEVSDGGDGAPKWYYFPNQEPDEVLFVKLFDSASLGQDSEHVGAPWHASPDIGFPKDAEPRESVEVRLVAFW